MEIGKIVGESYRHASWMPEWFRQFLEAPVIRPDYKLSEVLYERRDKAITNEARRKANEARHVES